MPVVSPLGDGICEEAPPEVAAERETTEGAAPPPLPPHAPAPAPAPGSAEGAAAAARLTAAELEEMHSIRNRIAELERFVREAGGIAA